MTTEYRPTRSDAPCRCLLSEHPDFGPHAVREHEEERCTGRWTFDPPCGGCINCLLAQAHYYSDCL